MLDICLVPLCIIPRDRLRSRAVAGGGYRHRQPSALDQTYGTHGMLAGPLERGASVHIAVSGRNGYNKGSKTHSAFDIELAKAYKRDSRAPLAAFVRSLGCPGGRCC